MNYLKNSMRTSNAVIQFGDFSMKYATRIELVLFALILFSTLLTYSETFNLSFLTDLSLVVLSITYYFMAFSRRGLGDPPSPYSLFFRKLIYITFTVCILSVFFYINRFSGYETVARIAPTALLACLISYFFLRARASEVNLLSTAETWRLLLYIFIELFIALDFLKDVTPPIK